MHGQMGMGFMLLFAPFKIEGCQASHSYGFFPQKPLNQAKRHFFIGHAPMIAACGPASSCILFKKTFMDVMHPRNPRAFEMAGRGCGQQQFY
jgi:hypothetical protein